MKRSFAVLLCLTTLGIVTDITAFWGGPYWGPPAPYYGYGYGPYYGGRYNKGAAIASGILGAGSLLAGAAAYGD